VSQKRLAEMDFGECHLYDPVRLYDNQIQRQELTVPHARVRNVVVSVLDWPHYIYKTNELRVEQRREEIPCASEFARG
jgi:hypothetical protein